jgi:hypothetical protein
MKYLRFGLIFVTMLLGVLICPAGVSAHQPRIPEGNEITVTDPEISKAYYNKLNGKPQVYRITADKPFVLYVNLLVPDIAGQKKDISAEIIKTGNPGITLAKLDGTIYEWKKFFEPFGHDKYLTGPEYKSSVPAGTYEIRVSSPGNDSKYSLAVGETEAFDVAESANAIKLIPKIKRSFFDKSPVDFILSPFGAGYIIVMFLLAFIFGFIYRIILKNAAKSVSLRSSKAWVNRGMHKNIGLSDRLLRTFIGIALLVFVVTTTWNPVILFLSGFCFFEAVFSWCGFYAALGKNTCPL